MFVSRRHTTITQIQKQVEQMYQHYYNYIQSILY